MEFEMLVNNREMNKITTNNITKPFFGKELMWIDRERNNLSITTKGYRSNFEALLSNKSSNPGIFSKSRLLLTYILNIEEITLTP